MSDKFSLALVGRTNVGKSSIFNGLLGFQRSIVGDIENLTRDFVFENIHLPQGPTIQLFDTAGLESHQTPLCPQIKRITLEFLKSVDLCLLVLDASVGLLDEDIRLYQSLVKQKTEVRIVWNKADLADPNTYYSAYRCTQEDFFTINALDESSIQNFLLDLAQYPAIAKFHEQDENQEDEIPTFGFFGRPNVGKSSLSNTITKKKDRFVVSNVAGTTRDYIIEPIELLGHQYQICDTAGLLSTKNNHPEIMERMTYYRTIMALKKVHVAVLVIDATEGLTLLDKKILELLQKFRRGLVIAVNKWDLLTEQERKFLKEQITYKLKGYSYAPILEVSAKNKTNLTLLKRAIDQVAQAFFAQVSTSQVNKFLSELVVKHEPPIRSGFRIKLRYIHVIDTRPLSLMVHGTQLQKLPASYVRFLRNSLCQHFNLVGIPLKLTFKNSSNPYVEEAQKEITY